MVYIMMFFLIGFLSNYTMQPNLVITLQPNDYALNSLADCGGMKYLPIQMNFVSCPYLTKYCKDAAHDNESRCSQYALRFLRFDNTNNNHDNSIPINREMGSLCLRITGLMLQKTVSKLLEITDYQACIARYGHFNPGNAGSQWVRDNQNSIFNNQTQHLLPYLYQFNTTFDSIFFKEIKTLITSFDRAIANRNCSNSDIEKTVELFILFMRDFELILAQHSDRKVKESHVLTSAIKIVTTISFIYMLSYILDH